MITGRRDWHLRTATHSSSAQSCKNENQNAVWQMFLKGILHHDFTGSVWRAQPESKCGEPVRTCALDQSMSRGKWVTLLYKPQWILRHYPPALKAWKSSFGSHVEKTTALLQHIHKRPLIMEILDQLMLLRSVVTTLQVSLRRRMWERIHKSAMNVSIPLAGWD